MTCKLDLTGQIVVGGNGCGCSGGSGGGSGPQKMQPLGLACGATFGTIQSTDCAQRVDSPNDFVPLPGVSMESVEFLYLQASSAISVRWGGTVALIQGTQVLGGVTFAGGEQFGFSVTTGGLAVPYSFIATAGTFTLEEIRNLLNAELVGQGQAPLFALDPSGTALSFSGPSKGQGTGIAVVIPLASIGFGTATSANGTDPTEVRTESFLNQWPSGEGVQDVEIKGTANVVVLAGGS